MATVRVAMSTKRSSIPAWCLVAGTIALAATRARADGPSPHPGIGGHVGIATMLVTFTNDDTITIADQFTLAYPIGIGLKLGDKAAIDFETVVSDPISPRGTTSLIVDPGILYDLGTVVIGLRVAWRIQSDTNFGLIPLIHKGIVDLGGGASWFVEAAFPTFVAARTDNTQTPPADKTTFDVDVVVHTGIGF
jgi:hypothetical protein